MKELNKDLLLIGLGVGSTLMYQKYSNDIMKKMDKVAKDTKKKLNKELDKMM